MVSKRINEEDYPQMPSNQIVLEAEPIT